MDAFHYRLKAAQRDLIERSGGILRAEKITGYARSQVGRWHNPNDAAHMPIVVVRALEADTGQPLITAILAEVNGRQLAEPEEERRSDVELLTAHSDLMLFEAEIARNMAEAIADGRVSPAEATVIDRAVAKAAQGLEELRAALAEIKARGGEPVSLRVVGEGL